VLVTGDVGFAGKRDEYDIAREWLRALCANLGCPEQNVWTVPGNHDVDQHEIKEGKVLRSFRSEVRDVELERLDDCLRDWLSDGSGPQLFRPFRNYIDFAGTFECDLGVERLSWHKDLFLNDGSTLRLLGLNSAMVSDDSDDDGENKLVVGAAQLRLEREQGVEYLVMCHHPPQWLRDADRFNDLVNSRSHLQLFGHKHKQRIETVNQSLRLYAGALHPDRTEMGWDPRYNVLTCEVTGAGENRKLAVSVYSRVWSDTETKFVADGDDKGNPERNYTFEIGAWSPPTRMKESDGKQSMVKSTHEVISTEDKAEDKSPRMDHTRRLIYRFLLLPYRKKVDIALRLDLLLDEDEGTDETELYRKLILRARTADKLADLWDHVEAEYKDAGSGDNPFKRA